jgi:hypothetical protein
MEYTHSDCWFDIKNIYMHFKQFQSLTMISQIELGTKDGSSVSLISINVCRLVGDTLKITRNFLYWNHQMHRDFLITLYKPFGQRCNNNEKNYNTITTLRDHLDGVQNVNSTVQICALPNRCQSIRTRNSVIDIGDVYIDHVGRDSSVGMANHYGTDGPGIESRWRPDFTHPSKSALGPTQPPIQCVSGLSRG